MSGLEFMQQMLSGALPFPPMAETANIGVTEVADGRVVFEGAPGPEHRNPMGTTHGGWFGTILDSALGCAAMTKVPKGSFYTTLEYKVNLARAIPEGMQCRATAIVDHAGRSTVVASAVLEGVSDQKLYATATTTCLIMPLR